MPIADYPIRFLLPNALTPQMFASQFSQSNNVSNAVFLHCKNEPINQRQIVVLPDFDTPFCETQSDKTPAKSLYGSVRKFRLSAETSLLFWNGQYPRLRDKARIRDARACRNTQSRDQSAFVRAERPAVALLPESEFNILFSIVA